MMSGWGMTQEAPQANSKSQAPQEKLQFPVDRLERMLRQGCGSKQIRGSALVYLAAVVEYLTAELLELAGHATWDHPRRCIMPRHLRLAIRSHQDLNKLLLGGDEVLQGGILPHSRAMLLKPKSSSSSQSKTLPLPENTLQEKSE